MGVSIFTSREENFSRRQHVLSSVVLGTKYYVRIVTKKTSEVTNIMHNKIVCDLWDLPGRVVTVLEPSNECDWVFPEVVMS